MKMIFFRASPWFAGALVSVCLLGCGLPVGGDYPYDMYDKDMKNLIDAMKKGGGLVGADNVILKDGGQETMEKLWGKVKEAKVVDTQHVAMRGFYSVDVKTEDPATTGKYRIVYWPTLGRVEVFISKQ